VRSMLRKVVGVEALQARQRFVSHWAAPALRPRYCTSGVVEASRSMPSTSACPASSCRY
jgi:hypothetical protein